MTQAQHQGMVISSFQLGTMVVGVMLSLGPLFIGRIAVEQAGRDGWLATLFASCIVLLNAWLIVRLARRYPQQTIAQYSRQLVGRVLGTCVAVVVIVLGILSSAISLWYTGHLFNTYILLQTPSYVIAGLLMLLTTYVALCDLRTLGRVVVVIFFCSLPFNFFFVSPVNNHGDWLNLLPLLEDGAGVLLQGVMGMLFAFAGYEVVQTYYPYVRDQRKVMLHVIWSVVFVSALFVLAVLTQQLVYPLEYLKKIWAPSVQYVALVTIPILERTDMIFILFWFVVLFKTNTLYFYRAVIETQLLFGTRRKVLVVLSLSLLAYGLSFISLSTEQMEQVLIILFSSSVGFALLLPPLLIGVDWWKRRSAGHD